MLKLIRLSKTTINNLSTSQKNVPSFIGTLFFWLKSITIVSREIDLKGVSGLSILKKAKGIKVPKVPKVPQPKAPVAKAPRPKTLFPKLDGPNKPPVLTSKSQPEIKINPVDLAPLPNIRPEGRKPDFTSELKRKSPYNKY